MKKSWLSRGERVFRNADGAADFGHLNRVGQPGAVKVIFPRLEDLRLGLQFSKWVGETTRRAQFERRCGNRPAVKAYGQSAPSRMRCKTGSS